MCISKRTIIGSDNGLSPGRCQAIIQTNAGILLIGPLRTNCSQILIAILSLLFNKMRLKVSSAKWHPFCRDLNMLIFFILLPPSQHYLSYLNYLRVQEYCGAVDSLYQYFDCQRAIADSSTSRSQQEEDSVSRGYRYAILNMAALQYRFNHR